LAIVWISLSLILIGNTLDQIVNPRLQSHHLFDPRRMVALVTGGGALHASPISDGDKAPAAGIQE
jgi:hypothetical protein